MSRSNPFSFVFGVTAELAAIVVVIALVPRLDLRTASQPGGVAGAPALQQPGAEQFGDARLAHETSYYQRRHIEQRLDQAGTALVDGVSERVLDAAADVLKPAPPRAEPAAQTSAPWTRY